MRLAALADALTTELKRRHDAGDLTTADLARRTNLSQPHIWHILHRRRALTIDTADALMIASGIGLEELARLIPPRPPMLDARVLVKRGKSGRARQAAAPQKRASVAPANDTPEPTAA